MPKVFRDKNADSVIEKLCDRLEAAEKKNSELKVLEEMVKNKTIEYDYLIEKDYEKLKNQIWLINDYLGKALNRWDIDGRFWVKEAKKLCEKDVKNMLKKD